MTTKLPSISQVQIKRMDHAKDLDLPLRASAQAAGFDLRAAIDATLTLEPGNRALVPTGIAVALPAGYEGQVRPRSGLAARHGVTLLNSPGTVDSDYRGEVQVVMINLGDEPFTVRRGDRIAQLVVAPVVAAEAEEAAELPSTARGEGGFGHTGTK